MKWVERLRSPRGRFAWSRGVSMVAILPLPPDMEARARAMYADPRVPLQVVAAFVGTSRTGLRRRVERWGWPDRSREAVGPGAPVRDGAARPLTDADRAALAAAMEHVVAGRVAALRQDAARPGADPDRTAREIAHHTRSLTTLRSYRATLDAPDPSVDAPARSLAELRDELRLHLERAEAEAAEPSDALGGDAEPG